METNTDFTRNDGRAPGSDKEQGTAMVEFSITLSLFLVIVFAIFEFALLLMHIGRANELTRDLTRIAIVNHPVCDIFEDGCAGETPGLVCPGGAAVRVTLAETGSGCGPNDNATACRMFTRASTVIPTITPEQIEVTYACSIAGAETRPEVVPLVSVALRELTQPLIIPGLLGLNNEITIPAFETTRTGEDLFTVRSF